MKLTIPLNPLRWIPRHKPHSVVPPAEQIQPVSDWPNPPVVAEQPIVPYVAPVRDWHPAAVEQMRSSHDPLPEEIPMATVPTAASVAAMAAATAPAPKSSLLKHIGRIVLKVLHIGEAVATDAAPIVAVAVPEVGPLYLTTLNLVQTAEAAFANTPGMGASKLGIVIQQLLPDLESWAVKNSISINQTSVEKYVNAIVASLNAFDEPASGS